MRSGIGRIALGSGVARGQEHDEEHGDEGGGAVERHAAIVAR
jgi:hypothetical protein